MRVPFPVHSVQGIVLPFHADVGASVSVHQGSGLVRRVLQVCGWVGGMTTALL